MQIKDLRFEVLLPAKAMQTHKLTSDIPTSRYRPTRCRPGEVCLRRKSSLMNVGFLIGQLACLSRKFRPNVSHAYLWLIARDSLRVLTLDANVRLLPGLVKVDEISFFYDVFILCDYEGESNRQHPRLKAGIRRQEEPHHVK